MSRHPVRPPHGTPVLGRLLVVRAWPDPVIDTLGHDPRSWYVEQFWLGTLGPTTTWLLRRLVAVLDAHPTGAGDGGGIEIAVAELARALGLGRRTGRAGPLDRCVERAVRFEAVRFEPDGALAVRRRLPPLNRHQLIRLPAGLQEAHRRWQEERPGAVDAIRRRAHQLALSLVELGEDVEGTERQLLRWRYHPALAHESAVWAWQRHEAAAAAAADPARCGGPGQAGAPSPADAPYEASSSTSVRTPKPVPPLVV